MEDVRPDWGFMRELGRINRKLGCKFNGTHFVITYTTEKYGEVNIWKVADEKGGFRQPDKRDLDMIEGSNLENRTIDEHFNLIKAYMEQYDEKKKADRKDTIRHLTLDNRVSLAQAFGRVAGYSKSNSAFRRIRFDKGMLPSGVE
jgi:hypothetical protein